MFVKEKLVIVILMFLCMVSIPCTAQVVSNNVERGRYTLYYSCDRINIEKEYLDNAYQIFRIRDILWNSPQIDSITIYAYASPEGPLARNKWLAEKRAIAARDFILENLPKNSAIKPENIHLRPMGENWEGLEAELEANYHLQNRDRVLKIIHSNVPTETKKWRLKRLDNGYTYHKIIHNHMPFLRMATWICVHTPVPYLKLNIDNSEKPIQPQVLQPLSRAIMPELFERRTILAVKTNLLYDAASLLNFSIEAPITKNISALYYHQFPWWRWGEANNEYCIRFLSIGAEARWWFNPDDQQHRLYRRDRLTGHFLGLYAESGKWDFEWGRSICHQGEHWSAGLSYGYSTPVGKYLNMEFSLSVGYASIPYRRYVPSENYEILWRDLENFGRWHYFGPTKAQVTLSLPISIKIKKKGGVR